MFLFCCRTPSSPAAGRSVPPPTSRQPPSAPVHAVPDTAAPASGGTVRGPSPLAVASGSATRPPPAVPALPTGWAARDLVAALACSGFKAPAVIFQIVADYTGDRQLPPPSTWTPIPNAVGAMPPGPVLAFSQVRGRPLDLDACFRGHPAWLQGDGATAEATVVAIVAARQGGGCWMHLYFPERPRQPALRDELVREVGFGGCLYSQHWSPAPSGMQRPRHAPEVLLPATPKGGPPPFYSGPRLLVAKGDWLGRADLGLYGFTYPTQGPMVPVCLVPRRAGKELGVFDGEATTAVDKAMKYRLLRLHDSQAALARAGHLDAVLAYGHLVTVLGHGKHQDSKGVSRPVAVVFAEDFSTSGASAPKVPPKPALAFQCLDGTIPEARSPSVEELRPRPSPSATPAHAKAFEACEFPAPEAWASLAGRKGYRYLLPLRGPESTTAKQAGIARS